MIFDADVWEKDSISLIVSTLASIYGTVLVSIYIAFVFTDIFKFPYFKVNNLETQSSDQCD